MSIGPFEIGSLIWGASFLVCIFFAAEILRSPRAEQSISAWILLFLLVPPVGVALYLLLGRRKLRRRAERKPVVVLAGPEADGRPVDLFDRLIRSFGFPPALDGNDVRFCGTGADACSAVIALIENARHSLWISVYILTADGIGRDIIDRLAVRASQGVQVRLLVDDVGSPHARRREFIAPLTMAGGAVARFMKLSFMPRSRVYSNLRNHRKMIVADQRRVWSGGMNLSELYLGSSDTKGFFHDLSFVIDGPAAAVYARVFAADWLFTTGEKLVLRELDRGAVAGAGPGVVQVVPSGPDMVRDPVYDVILTMVNQAERRLWAVSPYFIPDVGLLRAFRLAAQRGVDVRILTDLASDMALVDFAGIPYLRALAASGGRVLRFANGMIHAKALVMDDRLAFAGTTNLDQRSLFLNFEIMALFRDPASAATITRWMESYFPQCTSELPSATRWRQTAEGFVRLFAPVL